MQNNSNSINHRLFVYSLFLCSIKKWNIHIESFWFNGHAIKLCIPDEGDIKEWYFNNIDDEHATILPYWAKLWPAAKALCQYIAQQPGLVKDKTVLELAAGLGLPSLLSAVFAKRVFCSDYNEDAVPVIEQSIAANNFTNVSTAIIDWNAVPPELAPEVVLLSDINYDPAAFDQLYTVINRFLASGSTVIISTPQRLMAKPFIEQLQPFTTDRVAIDIDTVACTIFVLRYN